MYNQIITICDKYDLYLGKVSEFIGNIPKKNANEIINFPYNLTDCLEIKESLYYHISKTYQLNSKSPNLYICAPRSNFNNKLLSIGKELIGIPQIDSFKEYKEKIKKAKDEDPIVLFPVKSRFNTIGFIVVSKWGEEANDPSLQVGLNN